MLNKFKNHNKRKNNKQELHIKDKQNKKLILKIIILMNLFQQKMNLNCQ